MIRSHYIVCVCVCAESSTALGIIWSRWSPSNSLGGGSRGEGVATSGFTDGAGRAASGPAGGWSEQGHTRSRNYTQVRHNHVV